MVFVVAQKDWGAYVGWMMDERVWAGGRHWDTCRLEGMMQMLVDRLGQGHGQELCGQKLHKLHPVEVEL